jgi:hypothetical protein
VALEKNAPFLKADFAVLVAVDGVKGWTLHAGVTFLEVLKGDMALIVRIHASEAFISLAVVNGPIIRRPCPKGQADAKRKHTAKKIFHGVS